MIQPYRTAIFILGTVALLSGSSCAANGAASQAPTALVSRPLALATTPDTSFAASPAFPKTAIAKNTSNLLSSEQKAQLNQLGMPIIVPTYLPGGFRLTNFLAKKERDDYASGEYSWYSMFYQGTNNTCLEVSANVDPAMSTVNLQKTLVKTRLGAVEVYSGNVESKPMIVGLFSLGTKNGYMLRTGAWMPQTLPGGRCNPVSRKEYIQVLKSLERLK
ncbi:hypothetical protein [Allocoleopsis sp.]|uniref:hypothetical protein n=1 Tax=Allocoleopsis sp. TaxID=3088169 RepID=UPI002FCF489D